MKADKLDQCTLFASKPGSCPISLPFMHTFFFVYHVEKRSPFVFTTQHSTVWTSHCRPRKVTNEKKQKQKRNDERKQEKKNQILAYDQTNDFQRRFDFFFRFGRQMSSSSTIVANESKCFDIYVYFSTI
jgi:hypothetical protein